MRISRIELYQYLKPFEIQFHSAHLKRNSPESIIIKITFDNGLYGMGEAVPRNYVTGEDCSSVIRVIQECFCPALFSHEIKCRDNVVDLLEEFERECVRKKFSFYNSALCGMDVALLDALGKFYHVSAADFLGPAVREDIEYSVSIPFLPNETIKKLYPIVQGHDFRYVKVLMGKDENENVEKVRLIRSLMGTGVRIQVEANGTWSLKEALSNIDRLQEFDISAVEQPLPADDISSMIELKKRIRIPIILDESISSLSEARTLIEKDAFDIINIKLSKCGGFLRSKEIADFALARNTECQLGAHVGETAILSHAGIHFAMTVQNITHFAGASFLLFQSPSPTSGHHGKPKVNWEEKDPYGLGVESEHDNILRDSRLVVSVDNPSLKKPRAVNGSDPVAPETLWS